MNENTKTGVLAALAIVFILLAWFFRAPDIERLAIDDSGERFFDEFDPLSAASLEIVQFDEVLGSPQAFKVAKVNGRWSIPSHEGYPADAEAQLAEAAASVMDLVKGPAVSDQPADHALYGVVDPQESTAGSVGVGTRVDIRNAIGDTLVKIIVGKAVKDQPDLHFVRVPERDRVYTAAIDTSRFSTKFEDWIEDDLLKIDQPDIRQVVVNNYSIDEINRRRIPGDLIQLSTDRDSGEWRLQGLQEGEELVTERIDEMKLALDDLKIIDVHRKPEGLGRALRATDQLTLDQAGVRSLSQRGFYVVEGQLISNQGEMYVGMSTGVQYVLRFGEVAVGTHEGSRLDEADADDPGATDSGANRYLFVMAQFDRTLIPPPTYTQMPAEVESLANPPAGPPSGDQPDAAPGAGEEPDPDAAPPAPGGPRDTRFDALLQDTAPEASDEQEPPPPSGDEPAPQATGGDETKPTISEALEEARRMIQEENDKLKAEYEKKIADGQKLVQNLNERFADWYYVISDEVYRKIRLDRAELVRPAQEGPPADAAPPAPTPGVQP